MRWKMMYWAGLFIACFFLGNLALSAENVSDVSVDNDQDAAAKITGPLSPRDRTGSLNYTGGGVTSWYAYVDNVLPDTATYDWIELRGDTNATFVNSWTFHDDGYSYEGSPAPAARHPIGFSFPFYGTNHDSFRLCSNGLIQFTNIATSFSNGALPTTVVSGPGIFLYHDDLHLDRNGQLTDQVMYRNFGQYLVIEFDSIGVRSATCGPGGPANTLKMEAILFSDGRIKLQYDIVNICSAADSSMTIGIQSAGAAGSAAVQYAYGNGTVLVGHMPTSGLAIWFYRIYGAHDFATSAVTPVAEYYPASSSQTVTATFTNFGTTTESWPVHYIFNGGPVITDTTTILAHLESDVHSFDSLLTMPATPGTYVLKVWADSLNDELLTQNAKVCSLKVLYGASCGDPAVIATAGPDSATYNNLGAGTNSPGLPCYANNYNDMLFEREILPGHTITLWVSSLAWTTKAMNAALRWGGACPGDSLVKCIFNQTTAGANGYNQKFIWSNATADTQTAYFTIGSYTSAAGNAGNFSLAWNDTDNEHDFRMVEITSPLTSSYLPNEVVNVTATAKNLGSTEESAPIKYSFNGGATISEATATLTRFGTESHSFAVSLTLPELNGNLPLTIWADLATDQDRTNDTIRMSVVVFGGTNCGNSLVLPSSMVNDSATFNNCGAGTNDPGITCVATIYNDMVFSRTVETGQAVSFWINNVSWPTWQPRLTLRWGGDCPGTTVVNCVSIAPFNRTLSWTNSTGSTQTAYFTVGGQASNHCGNFKLNWKNEFCAALDEPYSEGFESATLVPNLPNCMSLENNDGIPPLWETYATTPRTGTKCASITGVATGDNDWLFTPGINMEGDRTYVVQYYRRVASTMSPDSIEVKAGPAPTAAAMTITVALPDTCKSTAYVQKTAGFPCTASGVYYIGWHAVTARTASSRTLIDDIQVYGSDICSTGTVTATGGFGADSVTLTTSLGGHWYGGLPRYQWYSGDSCSEANRIAGAIQSTYTTYASGLFSCRVYINDSIACAACDSASASVLICSAPAPLPLLEGFETLAPNNLPYCWRQESVGGVAPQWTTSISWPHNGNRSAVIGVSESDSLNDWLFSRPVHLETAVTYYLSFWYRAASSGAVERLEIAAGFEPNAAAMLNTLDSPFTFSNTAYIMRQIEITVSTSANYYIGFHAMSGVAQGGLWLDDIGLGTADSCSAPNLSVAAGVGSDSLKLRAVTTGGVPYPVHYQWFAGLDCTPGNEIVGETADSLWVHGSGVYSCRAWCGNAALCSDCDSANAVVIDCISGVDTPYLEPWTIPSLPYCWSQQNINGDASQWTYFGSMHHSAPYCAMLTTGSVPGDDWLFWKPIRMTAGLNYAIQYWRSSGLGEQTLQLSLGNTGTVADMTMELLPPYTFSGSTYVLDQAMFSPATTGVYVIGLHCTTEDVQTVVYVDDFEVFELPVCGAPTLVSVPAVSYPGVVTLTATASGGWGGSIQYQWYTGTGCSPENLIVDATLAQYSTTVSGVYSCKAYRLDPDNCSLCDSAYADVTEPAAGDMCANAILLTPPEVGTPTVVSDSTTGFYAHIPDTCLAGVSNGPDVFYTLTLTGQPEAGCHKIAMALTDGNTHLAVYNSLGNCVDGAALLCNDDDAAFTDLPDWDIPAQHPGGVNAYLAADLEPGTYLIRVAYAGSASGPYTLTVYDNGPCYTCDPATALSTNLNPADPTLLWWHFNAPAIGTYRVFSTVFPNNDGDPDNGADPQWTLDTALTVTSPGEVECVDLDGIAVGGYENFVVVHDCPIIGRCCYGDPPASDCDNMTKTECDALSGTWNHYRQCETDPCLPLR